MDRESECIKSRCRELAKEGAHFRTPPTDAAIVLDVITRLEAKVMHLEDALREAKPVYANNSNTASVRNGYEVGGYVKYYKIDPYYVRRALEAETDT